MESVIYELRASNIKEEDIQTIMSRVKNRLSEKNLDIELEKLGYAKIFTVDYDEYDYEGFDDFDDFELMHKSEKLSDYS